MAAITPTPVEQNRQDSCANVGTLPSADIGSPIPSYIVTLTKGLQGLNDPDLSVGYKAATKCLEAVMPVPGDPNKKYSLSINDETGAASVSLMDSSGCRILKGPPLQEAVQRIGDRLVEKSNPF